MEMEYLPQHMWEGNVFSCTGMSMSVQTITLEPLDTETSFIGR